MTSANEPGSIVVAGASAGGLNALTELVSRLPETLPAAVFIVMHMSKYSLVDVIRYHLEKHGRHPCRVPGNREQIIAGNIYIAPPDWHMLLKKDTIRLIKGPHENRYRPSIDVLFRSAAASYDSRVVGIILSGMLDDGTSGMSAIKRSGGICIIQEPTDAAFPDMPNNVLKNVEVDYRVPVADMGYILEDIFARPIRNDIPIPEDVILEADITERMASNISDLEKIGTHSNFTCPDCGGNLWRMRNDAAPRYRCHTGHVYTEDLLMKKQNQALEESLWVSIRMLEERRNMLLNVAGSEKDDVRKMQLSRAADMSEHAARLKELLINISRQKTPPDEGYL
jgi:two-component system chemotaxis response regulator CheB